MWQLAVVSSSRCKSHLQGIFKAAFLVDSAWLCLDPRLVTSRFWCVLAAISWQPEELEQNGVDVLTPHVPAPAQEHHPKAAED